MSELLNPTLYRALERHFGRVLLANTGESAITRVTVDAAGNRRLRVDHAGEQYRVNCNKCDDTGHHLYIGHLFGVRDRRTGNRHLFLINCFKCDGYGSHGAREALHDHLSDPNARPLTHAVVRPGRQIDLAAPIQPPGDIIPLHRLKPWHPANRYLAARFYDPEALSRFYGVGYCIDSRYLLARERIYVPIHQDGELRGWQTRHIGELDWKAEDSPPKWWTCPGMQRSRLLYNLDRAKHYPTVVVVEGCGDVWGFGPMAVATFGASISHEQRALLAKHWDQAIVLYDPEAMLDEQGQLKPRITELCHELSSRMAGACVPVVLPAGFDPGSLDRRYMRAFVDQEAKKAGLEPSWRKGAPKAITTATPPAPAPGRRGLRRRSGG